MPIAPRSGRGRRTLTRGMAWLALSAGLGGLAAMAEKQATPAPSAVESLRGLIVPDDAPARPPYLPARYDLDLSPAKDAEQDPTARVQQAADRQDRLRSLWAAVRNSPATKQTAAEQADLKLLAYAFAAANLDEAQRAANAAGPAARFRLARLLMAECRFEEAVRLLAALADMPQGPAPGDISRQALALLVQHGAERAALEKHIRLAPLGFNLADDLARRAGDPATRSFIEAVRQTTALRLPAELAAQDFVVSIGEEEPPAELDIDSLHDTRDRAAHWSPPRVGSPWQKAMYLDPQRLYLATGGPEFVLYQRGRSGSAASGPS